MSRKFGGMIISFIFPFYESSIANKKLWSQIEELKNLDKLKSECMGSYYMNDYEKLSEDDLMKFLNQTIEKKKSLEEKAKTNVFGITIAVTLITGLYKVLLDGNTNSSSELFKYSIALLAFYAIGQMILAGLSSLKVLGDVISQYELFPGDMLLSTDERCDTIALDTEINVKLNIVRNNLISSSYSCMKKSLVGLFILFILITIPTLFNGSTTNQISKSISKIDEKQEELLEKINYVEHNQMVLDKKGIDNQGEMISLKKELENTNKELNSIKIQAEKNAFKK